MTHTDDLRERVAKAIHECGPQGNKDGDDWEFGYIDQYVTAVYEQADRIIAAVHANLAARAMSDEVVEAVADAVSRTCVEDIAQRYHDASGTPPRVDDLRNDEEDRIASEATRALLLALGITESEVE